MHTIQLAHSPDSDDAFMFYALATGKIDTGGLEFVHLLKDIESLNQAAMSGQYEVTALSIHAFAFVHDKYLLLNSGASMGEGYGPVLVSKATLSLDDLPRKTIAIPGEKTSAYLALKLCSRDFPYRVMPFDEIIPAVLRSDADAGLIIHEGQLSFRDIGLRKVVDLGEWWQATRGLPLPLGGNAIRQDLGGEVIAQVDRLIRKSIEYALSNREEALQYALQFGRGLDSEQGDRFVSMYVNERTLDYGPEGRSAVQQFLDEGFAAGIIPHRVEVQFAGSS